MLRQSHLVSSLFSPLSYFFSPVIRARAPFSQRGADELRATLPRSRRDVQPHKHTNISNGHVLSRLFIVEGFPNTSSRTLLFNLQVDMKNVPFMCTSHSFFIFNHAACMCFLPFPPSHEFDGARWALRIFRGRYFSFFACVSLLSSCQADGLFGCVFFVSKCVHVQCCALQTLPSSAHTTFPQSELKTTLCIIRSFPLVPFFLLIYCFKK